MSTTKFLKCSCQHCGKRIEYPAEAAGMTLTCPHCHLQTELTVEVPEASETQPRRTWLVWSAFAVLLVLVVFAVAGPLIIKKIARRKAARTRAAAMSHSPTNAATQPVPSVLNHFEVSDVRIVREGSLDYAVGTLRNTLAKQRFSVRAEVELADDKDHSVGVASDYAPVIEPNAEWRFRALILKGTPAAARVSRIREQQ